MTINITSMHNNLNLAGELILTHIEDAIIIKETNEQLDKADHLYAKVVSEISSAAAKGKTIDISEDIAGFIEVNEKVAAITRFMIICSTFGIFPFGGRDKGFPVGLKDIL